MKKIISLLIVLILCLSLFSTVAFASTDISKIMPSGGFWIITDPPEVPVHRDFYIHPDSNGTIIIIPSQMESIQEDDYEPYVPEYEPDEVQPSPEPSDSPEPQIENDLAKDLFYMTNTARIENNVSSLEYNFDLQEAANLRAKEAAEKFSHTRPDDTNFDTAINIDYKICGENIVKAESTHVDAKILMDAWMNSQGHKDNILLYEYMSVAIGIYIDDTSTYAVQLFIG